MFDFMRPLVRTIVVLGIMSAGMAAYADPITDAENWFNQIKTLKGRFIQISDDGAYAEGDVYLKRPYWSRFDYDEPLETVLITTKIWLHVDEQDQEKLTSYPISETPLGILFSENVKLSLDGISTTATTKDGVVRIALDKPTGDDAGMLVLEFSESHLNCAAGLSPTAPACKPWWHFRIWKKIWLCPNGYLCRPIINNNTLTAIKTDQVNSYENHYMEY
jgi:outer membrane lipoprotein-sorting protein